MGPKRVTLAQLFTSIAVLTIVATGYFVGIVQIARAHVALEALIAFGVPVVLLAGGWYKNLHHR